MHTCPDTLPETHKSADRAIKLRHALLCRMYVCVWQCGWERRMRSSAGACWHHEPSAARGRRSETASRSDLTRASLVSRKASPRLPHAVWSVSRSARRKALLSAACWKPSLHPQLRLDCACLCSLRMLHFVDPAPSSQCRVLSSPDASPVLSAACVIGGERTHHSASGQRCRRRACVSPLGVTP